MRVFYKQKLLENRVIISEIKVKHQIRASVWPD